MNKWRGKRGGESGVTRHRVEVPVRGEASSPLATGWELVGGGGRIL